MDDQRRWWAEIGIQEEFEAWLDQLNKELALEEEGSGREIDESGEIRSERVLALDWFSVSGTLSDLRPLLVEWKECDGASCVLDNIQRRD